MCVNYRKNNFIDQIFLITLNSDSVSTLKVPLQNSAVFAAFAGIFDTASKLLLLHS